MNDRPAFSLKPWKALLPVLKNHRWPLAVDVSTNMLLAVVDLLIPLIQVRAVDEFIARGTLEGVWGFAAQYAGLIVAYVLLCVAYFKGCMLTEYGLGRDLKEACFKNLQRLSLNYYNVTSAGHSLSRVMSDTSLIGERVAWEIPNIMWSAAYIPGVMIAMLSLHAPLALMLIALIPLVAFLTVYFQKRLIALNREVRAQHSKITGGYNEGIMGAKTSKTLALEDKLCAEFEEITGASAKAGILHARMRAIYVPLTMLCGTLAASAVLGVGGHLVLGEVLSLGALSAFMTYALSLFRLFRQTAMFISMVISTQVNVERVTELMAEQPTVTDTPEVVERYGDCFEPKMENWERMRGEVAFEDVSFHYTNGGEEVLSHFNLHVPAGATVALVGETGAGKSTLVNLVCRFYEPTGGRILIDGRDARARSQLWLHSHIGYVLQEPHLFSGSIMENIRYGRPDATDDEVIEAAKAVHADRIAQKLPDGYGTDVGECGDKLSTGEKQLISFARAILAKPTIFVLDEATSSVDTQTEALIQHATKTLMDRTTSFVVAHRLSTIRQADVILVIENGGISEKGTHEELLALGGAYYELYTTQLSKQETKEDKKEA